MLTILHCSTMKNQQPHACDKFFSNLLWTIARLRWPVLGRSGYQLPVFLIRLPPLAHGCSGYWPSRGYCHFNPAWNATTSTRLADNGQSGTISTAQSTDYPHEAQLLCQFFPPVVAGPVNVNAAALQQPMQLSSNILQAGNMFTFSFKDDEAGSHPKDCYPESSCGKPCHQAHQFAIGEIGSTQEEQAGISQRKLGIYDRPPEV